MHNIVYVYSTLWLSPFPIFIFVCFFFIFFYFFFSCFVFCLLFYYFLCWILASFCKVLLLIMGYCCDFLLHSCQNVLNFVFFSLSVCLLFVWRCQSVCDSHVCHVSQSVGDVYTTKKNRFFFVCLFWFFWISFHCVLIIFWIFCCTV